MDQQHYFLKKDCVARDDSDAKRVNLTLPEPARCQSHYVLVRVRRDLLFQRKVAHPDLVLQNRYFLHKHMTCIIMQFYGRPNRTCTLTSASHKPVGTLCPEQLSSTDSSSAVCCTSRQCAPYQPMSLALLYSIRPRQSSPENTYEVMSSHNSPPLHRNTDVGRRGVNAMRT